MSRLTPDDVLLGLLAVQNCHGYQLLDHFRSPDQLGEVWNLSTSQLYAVLKRLEQNGWISGQAVEQPNAPPRMEYRLTDSGRVEMENWLHESHPSASIRAVRVEFLSRLYIARLLNIPTINIIRAQKQVCRAWQQSLIEQRSHTLPGVGFLAVDLVIMQLDAILQWIDRCEIRPLDDEEETE